MLEPWSRTERGWACLYLKREEEGEMEEAVLVVEESKKGGYWPHVLIFLLALSTILPATSLWDQICTQNNHKTTAKNSPLSQKASKIFHKVKELNITFLGWTRLVILFSYIACGKRHLPFPLSPITTPTPSSTLIFLSFFLSLITKNIYLFPPPHHHHSFHSGFGFSICWQKVCKESQPQLKFNASMNDIYPLLTFLLLSSVSWPINIKLVHNPKRRRISDYNIIICRNIQRYNTKSFSDLVML